MRLFLPLLALVAAPFLFSCDGPAQEPGTAPIAAMVPVVEVADYTERAYFASGASREWGSYCRLAPGVYLTAEHVARGGTPLVGPQGAVTRANAASDWALVGAEGIDPAWWTGMPPGVEGVIAGYPAADRDGEFFPGRVYGPDHDPAFVWVELLERDDGSHPEGVVGGVSGSCFVVDRKPAGVVVANGFSRIQGTSNTWALVVPVSVIAAQLGGIQSPAMSFSSLLSAPTLTTPERADLFYGVARE